ncbi:hypothetical protein AXF42_Ash019959 [Apostasia shenzhenica]|uniref:Uncharacterized protein n=1 Tax=Apostasia shenzhenica TaxID=1088818 RepID=A0A2I0AZJ2_9ASPA|nr:hypothetical protein AXF42_Ash019959 [Apostasia shenzhenica]
MRGADVNTWFQRCIPAEHVAPSWCLAFILFTNSSTRFHRSDPVKPRPRGFNQTSSTTSQVTTDNIDDDVTKQCVSQSNLVRPRRFLYKDIFFRPTNQESACSNCHESPEVVPILKDDILLLRLFVHPATNKRCEPRAYSPPFLQKIRIKLHHPLSINTSKQSSCKRTHRRAEKKESTRAAKVQASPWSSHFYCVRAPTDELSPSLSLFPFLNIVLALTTTFLL